MNRNVNVRQQYERIVRERAYAIYCRVGNTDAAANWLQAERELQQEGVVPCDFFNQYRELYTDKPKAEKPQ